MAKIYTGGTFDLFHAGHVNFLRQCYNLSRFMSPKDRKQFEGGWLAEPEVFVSLNTDEFIYQYKGHYPVYSYQERMDILLGCKYVGHVIPNSGGADSKPAILEVKPEIIAIGTDWASKDYYKQMGFTQEWLDEQNIQLIYLPYTPGATTTELKRRISDE